MGDGPNRGTEGRDTEEKDGWPAWKEGNEWSGVEWSGEEWSGGRARMTIAIPRFRVGISLVNGATRKRKHVETKERGRGMQGRG